MDSHRESSSKHLNKLVLSIDRKEYPGRATEQH